MYHLTKNQVIALNTTVSIMMACLGSALFYRIDVIIITWSFLTIYLICFCSYYGKNKKDLFATMVVHSLYIAILSVIAYVGLHHHLYLIIAFAAPAIVLSYIVQDVTNLMSNTAVMLSAIFITSFSFHLSHLLVSPGYVVHSLVGIGIGSFITIIIFLLLPYKGIMPEGSSVNRYSVIRGMRACFGIILLMLISSQYTIYNFSWIGFSLLFVMQGALGATIQKGISRLFGSIVGICLGVLAL